MVTISWGTWRLVLSRNTDSTCEPSLVTPETSSGSTRRVVCGHAWIPCVLTTSGGGKGIMLFYKVVLNLCFQS